MNKKNNSNLFMFIAIVFSGCILISNTTAFKLTQLGPFVLTSAALLFPITYIINDLIAEVYGFKQARNIIWFGFAMNLFMVLFYQFVIYLPSPVFFEGQEALKMVLGSSLRVSIGSMIAYLTGSFVNATIMSKMKVRSKGKHLIVRAVLSTMAGEFLDSLIFTVIVFAVTYDTQAVINMIITQTVVKTLIEIFMFPVTKRIINKVKKIEGVDVFDINISYNPIKA